MLILGMSALSSCAVNRVNRAAVSTTTVQTPVVSATVATLDVAAKPITYTYHPTKSERNLRLEQLVSNAIYEALQNNGSGDELVKVSYFVNGKARIFNRIKVKSISVTGYPATYKNFREPAAEDRENIDAVYNTVPTVKIQK